MANNATLTYEQGLFEYLHGAVLGPNDGPDPTTCSETEVALDPRAYKGQSPLGVPKPGDGLFVVATSDRTLALRGVRRDPIANGKIMAALVIRQWGGGYGGLNVTGTYFEWHEDEFGRRYGVRSEPAVDMFTHGVLEALAAVVRVPRQRLAAA